jgi:hypothetical protein
VKRFAALTCAGVSKATASPCARARRSSSCGLNLEKTGFTESSVRLPNAHNRSAPTSETALAWTFRAKPGARWKKRAGRPAGGSRFRREVCGKSGRRERSPNVAGFCAEHNAGYYTGYLTLRTGAAFITFSLFGLVGVVVNFDNLKPTSFPPYWTAVTNRPQEPGRWEVLRDATAPSRPNVFAQVSGVNGNSTYAFAVFDKVICRDGDLGVKFRIASNARRVKTAGIVWRYQDPQNYYLLHFSVDEKNIALFRVENGQTHPIPVRGGKSGAFSVSHDLRAGQWYVVKVIFRGGSIRVLFGNRQLFDATDDSLISPGKTGLWTQGGTEASFDDFRVDRKG